MKHLARCPRQQPHDGSWASIWVERILAQARSGVKRPARKDAEDARQLLRALDSPCRRGFSAFLSALRATLPSRGTGTGASCPPLDTTRLPPKMAQLVDSSALTSPALSSTSS